MTTAGEGVVFGDTVEVAGEIPLGGVSPGTGVVIPGIPGETSRDSFEHVQVAAADTWVVDHNLGRYPIAWSLFDEQGRVRDEYLVELPTVNRAVVRMDVPIAGTFRTL